MSMELRQRRPKIRSAKHLAWIRTLPSLIPGTGSVDAAHLRYAEELYAKDHTGMQEKPSDCWTVPLAHDVHMDQHRFGEREWWKERGVDPIVVAAFLWAHSGDDDAGWTIIRNAPLLNRKSEREATP